MQRGAVQVLTTVVPLDVVGEVNVGRFGLSVCLPGVVRARFCKVVVGETDFACSVSDRGDRDYTRWERRRSRAQQEGLEELQKVEVSDVVGSKLGLEAVFGLAFWGSHYTSQGQLFGSARQILESHNTRHYRRGR